MVERNRRLKSKQQLILDAEREIREVYEEFRVDLEKLKGNEEGAGYARFSSRFQHSIGSQIREILKDAIRRKVYISIENIFFDVAVRGSKRNRDGLQKVEGILKSGKAKVLFVFKTNRLFRKTYRSLEFVDRAVKSWQVRIIFVKDNLDSADPDFSGIKFQVLAMLDEHGAKVHVDNIQAQHMHMFAQNIVHGTITFGFCGIPIEGTETKLGRPQRRLAVCEKASKYVLKVFEWFTKDKLSIAEIVRKLNDDPDAPLPPKCVDGWTRLALKVLLRNERNLGIFKYGEKANVDLPDKDYTVRRSRKEPLAISVVPEFQIVDESLWFEAQKLLDENESKGGRPRGSDSQPTGSEIVRGLFCCPQHKCRLWISSNKIFCKKCAKLSRKKRCLASTLSTKLATEMLIAALVEKMTDDGDFIAQSYEAFSKSYAEISQPDETQLNTLKRQSTTLASKMKFAKRNVGATEAEMKETEELLQELRNARHEVDSKLKAIESAAKTPQRILSFDEYVVHLNSLAETLFAVATSRDPVELGRMRRLIQLLVGGKITLTQCGRKEKRKGWLRATFQVCLNPAVSDFPSGVLDDQNLSQTIAIDFKRPCSFQDEADQAYLLDQDPSLHRMVIAERLGCSKSKVTKLLKHAYEQRGEEMPDGHARRAGIKARKPPQHEAITADVMALYNEGLPMQDIAEAVGVCRDTITKVVKSWFSSQGLEVPDGRNRRKALNQNSRKRRGA